MSTVQTPDAVPGFRDRGTRLMVFGIFQILIGCFCLLMPVVVVVSALAPMPGAPQGQAVDVRTMIPAVVFYLGLAGVFIGLGIGSIRARRWAWTLTVVFSWIWLLGGVLGGVAFLLIMPKMWTSIDQQAKMPPEMILMMQIITGMMVGCIYILLPAVFLLFYQRASVRATCQRRDPKIPWTDRCPMPVLALSLLLAFSALSMLGTAAYGCILPLFGILISGVPGAAVLLLLIFIWACLAWGIYRLKMAAWWGTLFFYSAMMISTWLTFSRVSLMEMYEKMGLPKAQLEMIRKSGIADLTSGPLVWLFLISVAVLLGYLLYVRRYFVRRQQMEVNG